MALKNRNKAFGSDFDFFGLNKNGLMCELQEFLVIKPYDWWYTVTPGDVVVDIGANLGMFSANALDCDAKKVYMIEANRKLLKTAINNCAEYLMNETDVILHPINCFMGESVSVSNDPDKKVVFDYASETQNLEDLETMTIRELVESYHISNIDFLKIDIEGGEYNIGMADFRDWIYKNVKHIAMEVHFHQTDYNTWNLWKDFKDNFLMKYYLEGRLLMMNNPDHDNLHNIMQTTNFSNTIRPGSYFMLYCISEDSPYKRAPGLKV